MNETKQRKDRISNRQNGGWGTTSAMYFRTVQQVFEMSEKASEGDPARRSTLVYAGLPVLISGVEAFLIEHQHMLKDSSGIAALAGVDALKNVLKLYPLGNELQTDMEALIEIRNQIVHPSPLPFGKPEWPASLRRLHDLNVVDGDPPQSGTDVLAMLGVHPVFAWAVERCAQALDVVADSDAERERMFHRLAEYLWQVLGEPGEVELC